MKKRIISIVSIIFFTVFLISCNSGQTMQEYYVEKQSNNDFISLDLPASIVNLKEDVSPETKEAMQSVKKLNILAFKINDSNKDKYATEYDQVKKILKDEKYNELIRIKHDNVHIVIKYLGDDEEIDEFIFFASDKDQGFALARILGDKMSPEKIMKLAQNINDFDTDNDAFAQIGDLLKDIN